MRLQAHEKDGRIVFDFTDCSYEDRHIPSQAGFRWDGDLKFFDTKRWYTTDPVRAALLSQYADDDDEATQKALAPYVTAREDSRAFEQSDFIFPTPEGLAGFPYQNRGVEQMLQREANLLADEMGLGKTIQGIGVMNADESIKRVLVMCPASLKLNWRKEIKVWSTRDVGVGIAEGKVWPSIRSDADVKVVVINYDILTKHAKYLKAGEWDLMIVDEAHYLKNPKAQRTQFVFGGSKGRGEKKVEIEPIRAKRKIYMTGTPILNRPIELHPLLANLDPERWGNFMFYAKRYCAGHRGRFGWDFSGSSHLEELQDILRSTVMIRRLKKDVLTELPDKVRSVIEVEIDDAEALAAEREIFKKFGKDVYKKALDTNDFAMISKVRHQSAVAKLPSVIEYIEGVLENEQKVVIFAHHRDVMDTLREALSEYGVVNIDGSTPKIKRDEAVNRFQDDDRIRVFVGQMTAAGVGLTLTASNRVIFAELDWTPGNVSQAEDRCHRIGQKDTVWVDYVVAPETIDANLAEKLASKRKVINRATDAVTERVRQDNSAPKAAAAGQRKPIGPEDVPSISFAQSQAIHAAIRSIAEMDLDRAREVNGVGFSKMDGDFGHAMANAEKLSARMAIYSRKLVRKYWRQVDPELFEVIFPDPAEWPKALQKQAGVKA